MTIPTKLKYEKKTEFGKGFMTCLIKFAEHAENYLLTKEVIKKTKISPANLWFSGASDHLLELEIPERFKGTKIEENVKKLKDYVHRFRLSLSDNMTEEDVVEIQDLVREIAILVDKALGLEPDLGEF